jgi:flagellar motor switch protein FliN/FliY
MDDSVSENMPDIAAESVAAPGAAESPKGPTIDQQLAGMPTFARGLMRISVPVQVKLASQRKSIQEIVELGPGSIIKFEKTCDEPLEVVIGDRTIAHGEVVKVGDKFGVRIAGLVK